MKSPAIQPATLAKALPALTVVAALLLAILSYTLLFVPRLGRMVPGGGLDLAPYERRAAEARQYLDAVAAEQASFQQLNAQRKASVQNAIPARADSPGLYVTMDALATAHGMVLTSIDASENDKVATAAGRHPITVNARIEGATYPQFKRFLADLERSERLLDVVSVMFVPGSGAYDLTLRSYWVNPSPNAVTATP